MKRILLKRLYLVLALAVSLGLVGLLLPLVRTNDSNVRILKKKDNYSETAAVHDLSVALWEHPLDNIIILQWDGGEFDSFIVVYKRSTHQLGTNTEGAFVCSGISEFAIHETALGYGSLTGIKSRYPHNGDRDVNSLVRGIKVL